jgi:ATP-dependent DNA ligase
VDGEIVIATPHGLDFDALQMRLHPAASRVAKLAKETPASFVAFDVLAADGRDIAMTRRRTSARAARALLAASAAGHLTP